MVWIKKFGCRAFQTGLRLGIRAISFPEPELISGEGALSKLPDRLFAMNLKNVLIVSDKRLRDLSGFQKLLSGLKERGIDCTVFDDVSPNPTVKNAQNERDIYFSKGCDGIIGFGGGSPIDCAKAAGALVACTGKTVGDLRGYFKIHKSLPPLIAVPTTSGTGSETTVAAVITDDENHDKFAINDPKLVPKVAVLDPELTLSLPGPLTATTGMDALTHAVEAYIGTCGTRYTDEKAEKATELIFGNIIAAYENGDDISAREKMAWASYYAGCAFTRAFVGYVHAIAHALGGLYNTPHGLANAVVLPYVLEFYGESVYKKLARLAVAAKIGNSSEGEEKLAWRFIESVKELNRRMGIPTTIKELRREDIPRLSSHAMREANPFYPVPKLMDEAECAALLEKLVERQ